jgi:hypothetical protein
VRGVHHKHACGVMVRYARKRIYLHMREWHLRLDGSLRVSAKRKPTATPSYAGNIVYRNPLRAGG